MTNTYYLKFRSRIFKFSFLEVLYLVVAILLGGCGSKSSNPKDYWTLNEPQIYAWDTSEDANFRGTNSLLSEFSSTQITKALGYDSYLLFKDRETVVNLEVQTKCINQTTQQTYTAKMVGKIPKSLKVYLYNYLPDQVTFDDLDQNHSSDYLCNFDFIASNTITSKHSFSLNNLVINTSLQNELEIIAMPKDGSFIERTIMPIGRTTMAQRPSVYFNDGKNTFLFDKKIHKGLLTGPASIKCAGEGNTFSVQSRNDNLLNSLAETFSNLMLDGNTAFLKKCRVLAEIDLEDSPLFETSKADRETRKVWSEYFNIIFDQPSLQLSVIRNPLVASEGYPFNTSGYLDGSVTIFQIEILNSSKQPLNINFPSKNKILGQMIPLIYNAQRADFKPVNTYNDWGGLRIIQTHESFETELKFMSGGQRVTAVNIPVGEKKSIDIVVDKTFNCALPFPDIISTVPLAERGFIFKAIPLGSEEDNLVIDYLNQNSMDSFPDLFSLNALLESSEAKFFSIRNSQTRQRAFKTNELQLNMNRSTAIDTLVLRTTADLSVPPLVRLDSGYMASSEYTGVSMSRARQVRAAKKTNSYPSYIFTSTSETSYCKQL